MSLKIKWTEAIEERVIHDLFCTNWWGKEFMVNYAEIFINDHALSINPEPLPVPPDLCMVHLDKGNFYFSLNNYGWW